MLPMVAGRTATTRQILVYSSMLTLASELPWALGFAGALYGVTVAFCGAIFILLAFELNRSIGTDRRAAHRLFFFSIFYLFLLFAALLVDHSGSLFTPRRLSHDDRATVSPAATRRPSAARSAFTFKVREV